MRDVERGVEDDFTVRAGLAAGTMSRGFGLIAIAITGGLAVRDEP